MKLKKCHSQPELQAALFVTVIDVTAGFSISSDTIGTTEKCDCSHIVTVKLRVRNVLAFKQQIDVMGIP